MVTVSTLAKTREAHRKAADALAQVHAKAANEAKGHRDRIRQERKNQQKET